MKICFHRRKGFTLVELLVSMAILILLLGLLVSMTDTTSRTWAYTTGKVEQFRDSREAFESITRKLSQATLNTYWDYDNPSAPTKYLRQSELRFISANATLLTGNTDTPTHAIFFQTPLGYASDPTYSNMQTLLNTWGYYIEFGDDSQLRPGFITNQIAPLHYRFRIKEMMEPSESLTLYTYTSGTNSSGGAKNASYITNPPLPHPSQPSVTPSPTGTGLEWFTTALTSSTPPVHVLAENIVALVLLPKLSPQEDPTGILLAPYYNYDTTAINSNPAINPKNQLPPVVQVTMVAVDEASFSRFIGSGTSMPDLFTSNGIPFFQDAANYATDLAALQKNLQDKKLNYRVFTTNVSIKAAKWSRIQTN